MGLRSLLMWESTKKAENTQNYRALAVIYESIATIMSEFTHKNTDFAENPGCLTMRGSRMTI